MRLLAIDRLVLLMGNAILLKIIIVYQKITSNQQVFCV